MNNVYNNGIDLSVTVNGRPTRIYPHEGRYFIESREGTEYVIEISNRNWFRVEAVVAVDGLSVMNGEPASTEDFGYVIPAYGSVKIKGYRRSTEEVGAFKFSKREQSYAADKGDSSNVGVIAIAVWKEKIATWNTGTITIGQPWTYTTTTTGSPWTLGASTTMGTTGAVGLEGSNGPIGYSASSGQQNGITTVYMNAASATSSTVGAVNASFSHGTTWGGKIDDKVATTSFERDSIIAQTEVFYNAKENLEAMVLSWSRRNW